MKILLQIIEEEVDKQLLAALLMEQDDIYGSGGDSHGLGRFTDRSKFTGALLSPLVDLKNIALKGGAKLVTQVLGMVGTLIGQTILTLLPFNNPRTVKYLGQKLKFWEQSNLKFIDEQFKTETDQIKAGWETFKTDFWGLGFVASPFGAIAAAATAVKGVDAALSVGNVITGGKLEGLIEKINKDVEDPGSVKDYLKTGGRESEEKAREDTEKKIKSAHCMGQLNNPNWIDPECLGFAQRNMFPADAKGQQEYLDFVKGNFRQWRNDRAERFGIEYGREPERGETTNWDEQGIINLLHKQGLISEGVMDSVKRLFGKGEVAKVPNLDLPALLIAAQPSKTPIATSLAAMTKKFGTKAATKLMKDIALALVKDPASKAAEQAWITQNLPVVTTGIFNNLDAELNAGIVPDVTPEQIAAYKTSAGNIALKAIQDSINQNPKIKGDPPPAAALQAVKASVDAAAAQVKAVVPPPQPPAPPAATPPTQ